jgi:hypothetical protein
MLVHSVASIAYAGLKISGQHDNVGVDKIASLLFALFPVCALGGCGLVHVMAIGIVKTHILTFSSDFQNQLKQVVPYIQMVELGIPIVTFCFSILPFIGTVTQQNRETFAQLSLIGIAMGYVAFVCLFMYTSRWFRLAYIEHIQNDILADTTSDSAKLYQRAKQLRRAAVTFFVIVAVLYVITGSQRRTLRTSTYSILFVNAMTQIMLWAVMYTVSKVCMNMNISCVRVHLFICMYE